MNYIAVKVEINPFDSDLAEQIIANIEELGYESFEINDPYLTAYIKEDLYSERNFRMTLSFYDNRRDVILNFSSEFIKEENWNAVWESNFQPITVAGICTVKAGFHKNLPKTKYTITIDPKMAFGTGHHQTTSLMMEALLDEQIKGKSVLDMGCGTGILAILASKRGAAAPLHAIDIDPVAAESAIENTKRNRVSGKIVVMNGDASLLQKNRYDLILANINRNIILSDIKTYVSSLKSEGVLLLSGFYEDEIEMINRAAENESLEFVKSKSLDRWAVIKYKKGCLPLGD